jgi:hypothetical protein
LRLTKLEQEEMRAKVDPGNNTRHEIALLAPEGSIGAEFGVDTGQLSERFIKLNHFDSFHCVDKWDDHAHSREQYLAVTKKLMTYPEARVWRMTAQEFAGLVPNDYFGFIYIDCYAHTGQDGGSVLEALWPKLKEGGLFAGDDYDRRHWPKTHAAVNQFAQRVNKQVEVKDDFCAHAKVRMDGHPTWYFYK